MINCETFFKLPYGMYVVCSGSKEHGCGFISNVVFQVTATPPQFGFCCHKDNFTAEVIKQSKVFSISILQQDAPNEIIKHFGYESGHNKNKINTFKFQFGETSTPILLDHSIAFIECKLTQTVDAGTHYIFIGEVVSSEMLNESADPMTYDYYRKVKKGKSPKNAPTYSDKSKQTETKSTNMSNSKKYECNVCGYIYDPAVGDPDSGIKPGTSFEDIPNDWICPLCGVGKEDFSPVAE